LQINPETGQKFFEFIPGPAFGEIQLFDEISRTSPRMQAATLQVLCEGTITVAGKTYAANPFMIMTGNELESEGTHKPADALMDRVMFQVRATPFTIADRIEIIRRTDKFRQIKLEAIADYSMVNEAREFFHNNVVISPEIEEFIARLSDSLNKADQLGLFADLRQKFDFGDDEEILNPRAAIIEGRGMLHMTGAAKAIAGVLRFRNYVTLADVQKVLLPVIRHRTRFMPGAIEDFREKMRKDLALRFGGKAGRTEMHEYLLGELARLAWAHVLLDMGRSRHVGN
ncbi:MAG: AAA family ATPase, partial [Patescibacteria group bacterium]